MIGKNLPLRFYVASAAVVGAAVIVGAVAINKSEKARTVTSVTNNQNTCLASNQDLVGQVTLISTGNLYVKDEKSGKLCALKANDKLRLGDTIIAGKGANATLKLSSPKGAPEDADLVLIRPVPGEEYTVNAKLQRKGDGSIEATISP